MESSANVKHFQKKKIVITNAFVNLQNVKNLVRPLSKKRRFRTSSESQHVKVPDHLWNLHGSTFIKFLPLLQVDMICKMSPLVKSEISEVFVNTLNADDKYPVRVCENLQLPIQMKLC